VQPAVPGYTLGENAVREVAGLFGAMPRLQFGHRNLSIPSDPGSHYNTHVMPFRNDSGEEVPAYGCLRITGSVVVDDTLFLTAGKPNTYGAQHSHRFNTSEPVANGEYGVCRIGFGVKALYETSDGTPAFGERWGPRSGTWKLKKHTGGFSIIGGQSSGVVTVQQQPMLRFIGKTKAAVQIASRVDVDIFYRASDTAYTDTTVDMSQVMNLFGSIASGRYVRCDWEDDSSAPGRWIIIAAACQ
jgi:hypothetical protein